MEIDGYNWLHLLHCVTVVTMCVMPRWTTFYYVRVACDGQ